MAYGRRRGAVTIRVIVNEQEVYVPPGFRHVVRVRELRDVA